MLKQIFNQIDQLVFIVDQKGLLKFANKAVLLNLRFTESEIIGYQFQDLIVAAESLAAKEPENNCQCIHLKMKDQRQSVFEFDFEQSKWVDEQEETFTLLVQKTNLKTEKSEPKGTDHYKNIVDAIPDLLFVVDHAYTITHFYSSEGENTVLPVLDFVGKKVTDCLPPNAANVAVEALNEALKTGKSRNRTYPMYKDQDEFWYQLTVSSYQSEGKAAFVVLVRDITQAKLSEMALVESETRYRTLADNANVGIGITDGHENLVYVNQTLANMLGYTREEMLGKSLEDYAPAESFEYYKQKTLTRKPNETETYETIMIHKSGQYCTLSVAASPLFSSEDQYVGTIGVLIDISAQKSALEKLEDARKILEKQNLQLLQLNDLLLNQNEEISLKNTELALATRRAEASSRLKTAFLNNISHEVRTPLNGIVGFAQFIADEDMPASDKQEYVEAMNQSVSRLMNTISDILDVSLLMTGNMKMLYEEFVLNELMEEVFKHHQSFVDHKLIDFQLIRPDVSALKLYDDKTFVHKIISELVDNAIKYTPFGHIHFGFNLLHDEVLLFINDTGSGISEDILPEIYEPFTQQDSSSTRAHEGSGLGLTLVRGIVDLMNGTIKVETMKDRGTKFEIRLPLHQPVNEMVALSVEKVAEQSEQKHLILLAEDEDLNILYNKRIFKNQNYELVFARNGVEAVEMARTIPEIGLILMDIKLPVMDGLEATRQIRLFRPHLPIIAVTAYAGSDYYQLCLDAGCNEYVSKPFEPKDLFELINRLID